MLRHIRDALDAVSVAHPGLIERFGGHAMAAGLTLAREGYRAFSAAFAEVVDRSLPPEHRVGQILSDGGLSGDEMVLPVAELIRGAGPWGQAFPEPLFDGEFDVVEGRVVGERHLKLLLAHPDHRDATVEAIAFNFEVEDPASLARVFIAYRLDVNLYRGTKRLQLVIEHLEAR